MILSALISKYESLRVDYPVSENIGKRSGIIVHQDMMNLIMFETDRVPCIEVI